MADDYEDEIEGETPVADPAGADEDLQEIEGAIPVGAADAGADPMESASPIGDMPAGTEQLATDVSSQRRLTDPDAPSRVLAQGLRDYGLHQTTAVPDQRRQSRLRAYYSGAGAVDPETMQQLERAIDPQGRMGESERKLIALNTVFEYYSEMGQPQRAQAAAHAMLQNYRTMYNRYAALAKVAAGKGDVDQAIQFALKAHANVPNGQDLQIKRDPKNPNKLMYEVTDEDTGKRVAGGIASPEEVLAAATKHGMTFDDLIVASGMSRGRGGSSRGTQEAAPPSEAYSSETQRLGADPKARLDASRLAGMSRDERRSAQDLDRNRSNEARSEASAARSKEKEEKKAAAAAEKGAKPAKGPKAMTIAEKAKAKEMIKEAWDEENPEPEDPKKKDPDMTPAIANQLKSAAAGVMVSNPNMMPNDAVKVVKAITAVDPANPRQAMFDGSKNEDGTYTLKFSNGMTAKVSAETIAPLAAIRKKLVETHEGTAAAAAKKKAGEDKRAEENKAALKNMGGAPNPGNIQKRYSEGNRKRIMKGREDEVQVGAQ